MNCASPASLSRRKCSPWIITESNGARLVAPLGPILPTSTGKFRIPINVPPNPSLAYFELFAQCVVLDGTAPGFLGYTQAGKTVIYP